MASVRDLEEMLEKQYYSFIKRIIIMSTTYLSPAAWNPALALNFLSQFQITQTGHLQVGVAEPSNSSYEIDQALIYERPESFWDSCTSLTQWLKSQALQTYQQEHPEDTTQRTEITVKSKSMAARIGDDWIAYPHYHGDYGFHYTLFSTKSDHGVVSRKRLDLNRHPTGYPNTTCDLSFEHRTPAGLLSVSYLFDLVGSTILVTERKHALSTESIRAFLDLPSEVNEEEALLMLKQNLARREIQYARNPQSFREASPVFSEEGNRPGEPIPMNDRCKPEFTPIPGLGTHDIRHLRDFWEFAVRLLYGTE